MFLRCYSFTSLCHPQWWNFFITSLCRSAVEKVYNNARLVNCNKKNSFCWCPVRKLFYCSSLLRSVVFLRKRKRIRMEFIEGSAKYWILIILWWKIVHSVLSRSPLFFRSICSKVGILGVKAKVSTEFNRITVKYRSFFAFRNISLSLAKKNLPPSFS